MGSSSQVISVSGRPFILRNAPLLKRRRGDRENHRYRISRPATHAGPPTTTNPVWRNIVFAIKTSRSAEFASLPSEIAPVWSLLITAFLRPPLQFRQKLTPRPEFLYSPFFYPFPLFYPLSGCHFRHFTSFSVFFIFLGFPK